MQFRNSIDRYGAIAILIHWLVAVAVIGLFALGYWMVDLTYYDDWYRRAPDIHRSVGILLLAVMVLRVIWRFINPPPAPLSEHTRLEVLSAHAAHAVLYLLLFVATTADGSSISVFGWFAVPSVTGQVKGMEDIAGTIHYWSTWAIVVLAGLHALAALKHHVVDRDRTLLRMLGK